LKTPNTTTVLAEWLKWGASVCLESMSPSSNPNTTKKKKKEENPHKFKRN
jgi:hypothetical protein